MVLMGEVAPILIGLEMIILTAGEGLLLFIGSVVLLLAYRRSKLPALISAFPAAAAFFATDLFFVLFNFRRTTGSTIGIMDIVIAAVSVMTAVSIIYSILVLIIYIKQKKNKPMEEQNG